MKERSAREGRRECLFDLVRWRDGIGKAATSALAKGEFADGEGRETPAEAILHLAVEMESVVGVFEAMIATGPTGREARAAEDLRRIAVFLTHRFPAAACTDRDRRLGILLDWRELSVKVGEIFERFVAVIGANLPLDRRAAAYLSPYFGPLNVHESVRLQLIHTRLHLI